MSADYQPMYDLERIFIFDMATEICKRAFAIGLAHGIDFHQIGPDGKLSTSAPSTAAKPPSKPRKASNPTPVRAARPGWPRRPRGAKTPSRHSLSPSAASRISRNRTSRRSSNPGWNRRSTAVNLPPGHFFWDANDNHGEHEMTKGEELRGNLGGAWGRLSAISGDRTDQRRRDGPDAGRGQTLRNTGQRNKAQSDLGHRRSHRLDDEERPGNHGRHNAPNHTFTRRPGHTRYIRPGSGTNPPRSWSASSPLPAPRSPCWPTSNSAEPNLMTAGSEPPGSDRVSGFDASNAPLCD